MNYDDERESGQMKVLVVEPLKEPYIKTISDDLKSLQNEVGGGIEAIFPFWNLVAVILNSEGKLNGLMPNRGLYNSEGRIADVFVGTILITGLTEDDFGSISEELVEKYTDKYRNPERILYINGENIIALMSNEKGKESEMQPGNSTKSRKMKDENQQRETGCMRNANQTRHIGRCQKKAHEEVKYIFRELLPKHGLAVREEQLKLSHEMLDALWGDQIALCDAGVGIGKTYAYLVACIMLEKYKQRDGSIAGCSNHNRSAVISTSSIALQEAVRQEYLPFLSRILLEENLIRVPLKSMVRKGKEHFVCDSRLELRFPLSAIRGRTKSRKKRCNLSRHAMTWIRFMV